MDVPLVLACSALYISFMVVAFILMRYGVDRRLGPCHMEKNANDFEMDKSDKPEIQPITPNPNTPVTESSTNPNEIHTDNSDAECCICGATIVSRVANYSLPETPSELTCFFCKNPVDIDNDCDSEYDEDSEYTPQTPTNTPKVWYRGPSRLRRIDETETDIWLQFVSDSEDEHAN
jgi:hypothetical protein